MRTTNCLIAILTVSSVMLPAQTIQPLSGTFSNMSASKESGDINGYEIAVIPQGASPWIVFQCSEGAPSSPVLVPIKEDGNTFSFTVKDPGNACNGAYVATRTQAGLTLRGAADGETQNLLKGQSYWAKHEYSQTPYERTAKPFFEALQASCPDKHLENLPAPDLNYQIELFEPNLTPQQDKEFLAEAKVSCKDAIAGTGCGNVAFLDVAERREFLPKFVKEICHSQLKCTAFGECTSK
ncbi:hypothetical protein [Granulicella aggregans]|uniref:hypothetical protein n=1 Tax=Granulicella aggregans TaxID=474949 RepID=UPI0021E085F5|nr:hypothetical protein [Granulicella aggregans]